jgi:hypothetical protein
MKTQQHLSKTLTISLWVAQLLLATLFLSGAAMKLFMPADKLAAMWPWTAGNRKLVIVTGILDGLAGLGLLLPGLSGILPQLTFYAALGAAALMLAGIIFHIYRGEGSQIGINIFALFAALFIVWGRWLF